MSWVVLQFLPTQGKVMFSEASVCSGGLPPEGSASKGVCSQWGLPPGGLPLGVSDSGGSAFSSGGYPQGGSASRGSASRGFCLQGVYPLPPVLTSNGSHCIRWYTSYWNAFLFSIDLISIFEEER